MRADRHPLSRPVCTALLIAALGVPVSLPAMAQTNGTAVQVADLSVRAQMLRKRMNAKQRLSVSDLRYLADSGDGLAAFNFAKMLEGMNDPDLLPDAVHYYAMATYLGRDFAKKRMISLMSSRDVTLSAGQLKSAQDALLKLWNGGDTEVAVALAKMYEAGWPFPQDKAEAQVWLTRAAQGGDIDAAQKLAMGAIMPSDGTVADPAAVRAALEMLAASGDPGKVAIAQNLLARLPAETGTDTNGVSQ